MKKNSFFCFCKSHKLFPPELFFSFSETYKKRLEVFSLREYKCCVVGGEASAALACLG